MPVSRKAQAAAPKFKNYLSEVSEAAIFDAIRQSLVACGGKRIMFDYDTAGRAVNIEFVLVLQGQPYTFRLPARFEQAEPLVAESRSRSHTTRLSGEALTDQAYRAVWATIRDWLAAHLALIRLGVKAEEVFFPYMLNTQGQTVFEAFEQSRQALPMPRVTEIH